VRASFVVGGVALVGLVAGGWWAWRFIHNQLPDLVAQNLSKTFNRPVKVGPVEGVSLTSLQFGPSSVPATPTDADQVQIDTVKVRFNLLDFFWDRTLGLNVTLVHPTGYIDQNAEGQWITTQLNQGGGPEGPIKLELDTLRAINGRFVLAPYAKKDLQESTIAETDRTQNRPNAPTAKPTVQTAIVMEDIDATATFRDNNKLISYVVSGQPDSGGMFRIQGTTDLRLENASKTRLQINAQNLLAPDVSLLIPLPADLKTGRISTDLRVEFPPPGQPLALYGTVRAQNVTAQVDGIPKPFTNVNGGLRFRGQQITLQDAQGRYGQALAKVSGSINTQKGFDLSVHVQPITLANLLQTAGVSKTSVPVPISGSVQADIKLTGPFNQFVAAGVVTNTQPIQVDRVKFQSARARFAATKQGVLVDQIQANLAQGGQITGKGRVKLGQQGGLVFDFLANNIAANPIARAYGANLANFTLGQVDATAQVFGSLNNIQTLVQWQAPQATYPGRGTIAINGGTIQFRDTALLVEGGIVQGQGTIAKGNWQASLQGSGIELSRFSPELRGLFSGNFQLAGSLANLNPAAIQAAGQVRLSQGLSIINTPLTASVRWLGDRLQVVQANARGFNANGFVFAQLQGAGAPAITNLDLNVQLRNYPVADLPIPTPAQINLAGQTDFNGRITGPLSAIKVAGRLGLYDLAVNQLAFEPALTGTFQFGLNQGLALNVAGAQDRIAVQLDARNRPKSFYVRQGNAIAQGHSVGDRLLASIENFPLQALNVSPASSYGIGPVSGLLNGTFDIGLANLQNPNVSGQVAIVQPAVGYINANLFTGQFRYANGVAVLQDSSLQWGKSRYLLSGTFNPGSDPQLQAKIVAAPGRVEDILSALQIFQLGDFGRGLKPPTYATAAAVQTVPVGMPNAALLTQLRRFSEIMALRQQQLAQQEKNSFLPDLADLQGPFSGEVNVAYSGKTGVSANFDLNGQNWSWGQYQVQQFVAQGSFANGVLTLLPLRFASGRSVLTFSGQVGGEEQSGQLLAENIPADMVQKLLKLPINLQGNLNANATLAGSIGNPQVVGELTLADGSVNQKPIPEARSLFGYSDARLNFDGRFVQQSEQNAFQLNGSIPYSLPFMTVQPDSDQFSLSVNIRNDGLALLNLFTDQVAWQGGEGEINLRASGTLNTQNGFDIRPQAVGTATFKDATFTAKALPEPLTNVNGKIDFINDRIVVDSLKGRFSNGQVMAQGTIPILFPINFDNPGGSASPLTIALNKIRINFQNLYQGGVDGRVVLTGTALAPQLGGEILLSDGRVLIPNSSGGAGLNGATGASNASNATTVAASNTGETASNSTNPIQFQDLKLTLGKNLRVTLDPILSFVTKGNLLINGTLDDLRPDGRVKLLSGQVNIFTTNFRLANGYENTATFNPDQGLDPYLDVRLITSVPEVTRYPTKQDNSPFPPNEVAVTAPSALGQIETIRIQARVLGPASELFTNSNVLELSSSPSRSQTEILALLGGSNLIGSGGGAAATTAIASIAGSTILGRLQNLISETLGVVDFSLFPTTVVRDESTLVPALAAELGFDITRNLSVSVLQALTVEAPTQLNLRYRLTNQLTLRGGTNFAGESQAVLEFETRF
jgi:translocation and assembly module TamB